VSDQEVTNVPADDVGTDRFWPVLLAWPLIAIGLVAIVGRLTNPSLALLVGAWSLATVLLAAGRWVYGSWAHLVASASALGAGVLVIVVGLLQIGTAGVNSDGTRSTTSRVAGPTASLSASGSPNPSLSRGAVPSVGAGVGRRKITQSMVADLDFNGMQLRGASLDDLDLRGESFAGADIAGSSFRRSNLEGVSMRGANLRGVDLSGACLRRTDLSGAELSGADAEGADTADAVVTPPAAAAARHWPRSSAQPLAACDR
jgi:hypothetical protein